MRRHNVDLLLDPVLKFIEYKRPSEDSYQIKGGVFLYLAFDKKDVYAMNPEDVLEREPEFIIIQRRGKWCQITLKEIKHEITAIP